MRATMMTAMTVALVGATPASAQSDKLGSKTLDDLVTCKAIAGDAVRLACFDRVSGRIIAARASGDLLALDREKVVENKRRAFGLARAGDNPLGGGAADRLTKVAEVATTITLVKPSSYGRFLIQLANAMVWETIDPVTLPPHTGDPITIKKASFGGFRGAIGTSGPILMKRIR